MKDSHWSTQKEEAAGYWQLAFTLVLFKLMPVIFLKAIAFPVGFFYFLFSRKGREFSRAYLRQLAIAFPGLKISSLRHIISFSIALVEKLESWGGKVSFKRIHFQNDDIIELIKKLEKSEGAMLLSSHLGNMEFIRALADFNRTGVSKDIPVNAIVDFNVTAHFNRMLRRLNPNSSAQIINARELGPQSILILQDRLSAGELVVIAADRTSAVSTSRYLPLPFLGSEAPFPYGPFFLAALSEAPIYAVFAMRKRDLSLTSQYNLYVHKSPVSFDCPRREREDRITELARWYTSLLEHYCKLYPCQWYNFFDFWHPAKAGRRSGAV
jgi:predicted LPLAT superfamily acyltransferase